MSVSLVFWIDGVIFYISQITTNTTHHAAHRSPAHLIDGNVLLAEEHTFHASDFEQTAGEGRAQRRLARGKIKGWPIGYELCADEELK